MKKCGEKSVAIDAKRDNANFERRKCNMTIHFIAEMLPKGFYWAHIAATGNAVRLTNF